MFKYFEILPVWLQIVTSIIFLLCFIAVIVAVTYVLVHRKIKIKIGEKEIDIQEEKVEAPIATEAPDVKN